MDNGLDKGRQREAAGGQRVPAAYRKPVKYADYGKTADPAVSFNFHGRRGKRTWIVLLCCFVAIVVCVVAYQYAAEQRRIAEAAAAQLAADEELRQKLDQERVEYEQFSSSTVFLTGITVEGVDIGGMTLEEARAALSAATNGQRPTGSIQLTYADKVFSVDLGDVSVTTDMDDVLAEAYRLGKTGDYAAMKTEIADVNANGRSFSLTATYDYTNLLADITTIAALLNTDPVNAGVQGIDAETRQITFSDGVTGVIVQEDALVQSITEAIESKAFAPIAIPVLETPPAVTRADLEGRYVLRAKATTNFKGSSRERKFNIRKGCGMISGTVLKPGAVFSANDKLGVRTVKNGWQIAGAYEGGAVVEAAGGGVCQLSSTLYNAVVKADLQIVSRRNHSMRVNYIKQGLDATINSVGNLIDFQFSNNTTSDIVVFGYTDGDDLTFEIWGLPFATDEYDEIRLTSELSETLSPSGEEVVIEVPVGTKKHDNSPMAAGETYVAVARQNGSIYHSYKNYYKNGVFVRKEFLATSTYKAFAGEIWTCQVSSAPTGDPSSTPDPGIVTPIWP